ncbi:Hachiman antiphage defense system protein HamA [Mucilaginibacter sp. PAMB04274]|uniref:Hachiman antiphage defense system protein HamA n=1 Tax=Mucilaginibacter sp. PAMB04274 TaxID=3138568 RepID=UPI0031F6BDF9
MFTEDWAQHIKIDRGQILDQLNQHFFSISDKLALRFYTLKPSGTRLMVNGICEVLHDALAYYVYGEAEIAKKGEMWAGLNAKSFFGQKQPQTDGKYGELLLFVLVESILACKMIAHKIRSLSNYSDQVKGGDGIFIGNYEVGGTPHPAYLIGESKVTSTFSDALSEALISINRFHDLRSKADFLDNELIVAKEFIKVTIDNIDELYDRLTPTSDAFKRQVLVHPILLMYTTTSFGKLERESHTYEELEKAIADKVIGKDKVLVRKITEKLKEYPEVEKVFLDFFILPCNSVDDFRNSMYQKIHGVPYSNPQKNG